MDAPRFLFACCQPGAEAVLKRELVLTHPDWRFAFSRPGFLTFKWTGSEQPSSRLQLKSVFARCFGYSLGALNGTDDERRKEALEKFSDHRFQQLHVWQRSLAKDPSEQTDDQTRLFGESVRQQMLHDELLPPSAQINDPATIGQAVADLIRVAPDQWWIGWHLANSFGQRWPGGVPHLERPTAIVSRAYMKIREAMLWSQLPMRPGDRCVELGSAPGGASQALLDGGMIVLGIDPAEIDPAVLMHENFTHIRKRGADVRRRQLRGSKWLVADANVAPKHALDTVESIVTHRSSSVQGMLLTLKLLDWRLADDLPNFVRRIRSWGYTDVRCRQLVWNQQEVCVAASRSRGIRRRRRPNVPSTRQPADKNC